MGGKALKNIKVSRINLSTYNKIKEDIKIKFFQICEIDFPYDIPEKNDFGDIDVLYKITSPINIIQLINEIFNPKEIVTNGNVCSFAYWFEETNEYFQVDMIYCNSIIMNKFYFSYGDLGNILGKNVKYLGLTLGIDGLYIIPDSKLIKKYINMSKMKIYTDLDTISNFNYNKNIILTDNPKEICNYLDLDYEKWEKGFLTLTDIFDWVIKSKKFNANAFNVSNYEHRHKISTRPMYSKFTKYIDNNYKIILDTIDNKENIQLESIYYFMKEDELKKMIEDIIIKCIRKKKFSGKILVENGIENKDIGKIIKDIKQYIKIKCNMDFDIWIDITSEDEINYVIKEYIKDKNNFYRKNYVDK